MEVWRKILPKNQLHYTIMAPWQYWLGYRITRPKSAFSMTLNASNRLLQIFK